MHTPDLITPIAHVCNTYVAARQLPFKNTPMRKTLKDIADGISSLVAPISPTLCVDYSIGKGSWAFHPWVAVYDTRVTDTVRHGICAGMSWNDDMSGFAYGIFFGREGLSEHTGKLIDSHAIERLAFITQAAGIYADAFPTTSEQHVYSRFSFSTHARWLGFYHSRNRLPDNNTLIHTFLFTLMVYTTITPAWIERYGTH
jgi:hypothetical protein